MCISCIIKVSFVSKDRRCAFRRSWPSEPSEAGADSSQPTARPAGHGVLQQAVRPGSSPAPRWSDATPPATVTAVCNSVERWRAPPPVGIACCNGTTLSYRGMLSSAERGKDAVQGPKKKQGCSSAGNVNCIDPPRFIANLLSFCSQHHMASDCEAFPCVSA